MHDVTDGESQGGAMNTTLRGNYLGIKAAVALLVVMITLAVFITSRPDATVGDRGSDPSISVTSGGGSSFTQDPFIGHHAYVISRYHDGSLR
jgi:hypothetical protein